jgi:hypothetical protein
VNPMLLTCLNSDLLIIGWHDNLYMNVLSKIIWLDTWVSIELWTIDCDNVIIEYVCLITCEVNWIWFNQWDGISSIELLRYAYVVISLYDEMVKLYDW